MTDRWQFDIVKDNEIVNAGGFFCQACVVGKPLDDISPDPRYCQGCYDVMVAEAELLTERGITKKPQWIPRKVENMDTRPAATTPTGKNKPCKKPVTAGIKGDSKYIDDVTAKIGDMSQRGMSCRTIQEELSKDGVTISYRTIARRLQGVLV